jgi:endonuclease-3
MDNLWATGELTPQRIAGMAPEELEELIKPAGLYRAKARALIEASAALIAKHGGDVPKTMAELQALRGVGPKIASLALNCCWHLNAAIGCDTHVTRISQRLGWVPGGAAAKNDAEFVRRQLEEWLPKPFWRPINYGLVGFGQVVCSAKNPKCAECPVQSLCPSASAFKKKQK